MINLSPQVLPSRGALLRRASLSRRRCVSARLKRTPYAYCLAARNSREAGGSSELHSSSIHTGIFISPWGVRWVEGEERRLKGGRLNTCLTKNGDLERLKTCLQRQIKHECNLSEENRLPWSICGKSGGTSVLFCVCAQLHEEPQHWPKKKEMQLSHANHTWAALSGLKICLFFSLMDTNLRQRGCGYVHVTPCRHRQQWRNVWPAPVALGTVSRGRAPPSSRILPPRGLVRQMAGRKGFWECLGILAW